MLKNFQYGDIQVTPFTAIKTWDLLNTHKDDLVLIEEPSREIFVAQDFIDYSNGLETPILNRECNIALEQQTPDVVLYEEGIKKDGFFYPDQEEQNINGSYKRLVHTQIKNAFYNTYQNPLQIFGLENIDLQSNKTQKFFSDYIRVFTIPRQIFGEKIIEGSISLVDNSLDDFYTITDDSCGNLIAKENLFSKVQEARHFNNILTTGSNSYCVFYTASNLENIYPYDPIMWLKASDQTSIYKDSNGYVSYWKDSSYYDHSPGQSEQFKKPIFRTGSSDPGNRLLFNNTVGTESIQLTHDLQLVPPYTILVVSTAPNFAKVRSLAYFDLGNIYQTTKPNYSGSGVQSNSGSFVTSSNYSQFFGTIVHSVKNIESFWFNSSSNKIISQSQTSSGPMVASNVFSIGNDFTNINGFTGSLYEMIIYNRELSTSQLNDVFNTYIYPKFQPIFW